MNAKKLHLHSMIVHAIIALGPLAAISLILKTYGVDVGPVKYQSFEILEVFSIVMIFLISIPSTITGIGDRNKIYGKWHSTHKIKLWFSIVLMLASLYEVAALLCPHSDKLTEMNTLYGVLVIGVNNIAIWALSAYGLKISIGRQSFEKTSYVPDMYNTKDRIDILDEVRGYMHDKVKIVDFEIE